MKRPGRGLPSFLKCLECGAPTCGTVICWGCYEATRPFAEAGGRVPARRKGAATPRPDRAADDE